jgi:DNA-binding transcriptional LysR family regulator
MELEVRHLRVLCAIAETGSLTRAAAALRLTQPGLSAQLRRIETMLGGQLFDRSGAGMAPTALGEVVLTRARAVLPALDDLLGVAALTARAERAPLRFRIGSVNAPLIGGVIDAVRELYPGAQVVSREQGSPLPLVEDVAEGRLEAAVVGDSPGYELAPRPGVVLTPIVTEPLFVAVPASHPLAGCPEIDLADLADDDWVTPRPDNDRTLEYWSTTLAIAGRRMRVLHEAEGRLLLEIVRTGHAVSLCQATFEEVPGIAVRPIVGDPLWYRHVLAWHQDGPLAAYGARLAEGADSAYQAAAARSTAHRNWTESRRAAGGP